jgi:hypothetical protein
MHLLRTTTGAGWGSSVPYGESAIKSLGTLQLTLSEPRVNRAPKLGGPTRDEGLDADS